MGKATYKIESKIILIHCGKWDKVNQKLEKGSEYLVEVETLATIYLNGRTFYLLNYLREGTPRNITDAHSGFNVFSEFIEFQQLKKTVEEFEKWITPRWETYLKVCEKFKIRKNLPITRLERQTFTKTETVPVWLF